VFWDETAQRYFPVTMTGIDEQKHTVSFSTVHFSPFPVLAAPAMSMLTAYDTGFSPENDGFFHPNFGTYFKPGGHCEGFATYAMWYYVEKRLGRGEDPLHQLYRNLPPDTDPACADCDPVRWEDDPTARDVAAWSYPWGNYSFWDDLVMGQTNQLWTLRNILFYFDTMHAPQILILAPHYPYQVGDVLHAVLAYKYDPPKDGIFTTEPEHRGRLYVYDSNLCRTEVCPFATLDFGPRPEDPDGPLRFFNYSANPIYNVPFEVFGWNSLSNVMRPSGFEDIYQQAKLGFSPSNSTFVFMNITSATDAKGNPLDVSAGEIQMTAVGPITVHGVVDVQGRTLLGEPKFMPRFIRVWLDEVPMGIDDVEIDANGNFSFVVPAEPDKKEFVLWLVAHDNFNNPWNAYAGFKRVKVTIKPPDIDVYLSREGSKVLCPGRTVKLVAEVVDGNTGLPYTGSCTIPGMPGPPLVEWSSSDPSIASVDGGVVTAGIPGRASITASCGGATRTASIKVVRHDPLTGTLGHRCFLVTVTSMALDPNYPGESCALVGSQGTAPVSGRSLGITGSGGYYSVTRPPYAVSGAEEGYAVFDIAGLHDMFTESYNPYYPDDYAHVYNIRRNWTASLGADMCEFTGYYDWDFYGPVDSCAGRNSVILTPVDFIIEGGDPFSFCE
jgi:hypothetical protein